MSKNQAIGMFAVLMVAVVVVLLVSDRMDTGVWVSTVTILLTLGALSVLVLRAQSAMLKELRRLATANKRSAEKVGRELSKVSARQEKVEEKLAAMRTEVRGTNTKNAVHIEKAAGHADRVRALRVRFEEAERRILAGTEVSRLSMEESVKKLNHQSMRANREAVLQTESLLQLFAEGGTGDRAPMPPTGGFALDAQSLLHLLHLIRSKRPRSILELGSGTSTIWIAYLCRELGIEFVSLDHLQEYAERTRGALRRHGLEDVVDLRVAPLESYDLDGQTFQWYASEELSDLEQIDLLIVDGPPQSTGPRARYPALPVLWDKLSDTATVILDDTHRAGEVEIFESWRGRFENLVQEDEGLSRIGVLARKIGV